MTLPKRCPRCSGHVEIGYRGPNFGHIRCLVCGLSTEDMDMDCAIDEWNGRTCRWRGCCRVPSAEGT